MLLIFVCLFFVFLVLGGCNFVVVGGALTPNGGAGLVLGCDGTA